MSISNQFRYFAERINIHYQDLMNSFTYVCMDEESKAPFIKALDEYKDFSARSLDICICLSPVLAPLNDMSKGAEKVTSFYEFSKAFTAYFDDGWKNTVVEDDKGGRCVNSFLYHDVNYMARSAEAFLQAYDACSESGKTRLNAMLSSKGEEEIDMYQYYAANRENTDLQSKLKAVRANMEAQGIHLR
jgi:hypothetical protein